MRFVVNETQTLTNVHDQDSCKGPACVIHRPSHHHMTSWPLLYRQDRRMFERICQHGVGHPDPDDPTEDRTHGCCGCCFKEIDDMTGTYEVTVLVTGDIRKVTDFVNHLEDGHGYEVIQVDKIGA